MTLSGDVNTTSSALADIKDAIIENGVTPSGNITTYATAISNISPFYSVQENSDYFNLLDGADTIFTTAEVGVYSTQNDLLIALGSSLFTVNEEI